MIVGKPGIKTIEDLKGKKVGVEVGFVEHLLLLNGLQKTGMTESDVTLVNVQDQRDAASARLRRGRCDRRLAADLGPGDARPAGCAPGLHLRRRARPDLRRGRRQPGELGAQQEPTGRRSRRSGIASSTTSTIPPRRTTPSRSWPHASDLTPKPTSRCSRAPSCSTSPKGRRSSRRPTDFDSLYGSTTIADDFNVKNEVYKEPQDVDSYIDPSLTNAVAPMAAAAP